MAQVQATALLYCRQGGSDKVYGVGLIIEDDGIRQFLGAFDGAQRFVGMSLKREVNFSHAVVDAETDVSPSPVCHRIRRRPDVPTIRSPYPARRSPRTSVRSLCPTCQESSTWAELTAWATPARADRIRSRRSVSSPVEAGPLCVGLDGRSPA